MAIDPSTYGYNGLEGGAEGTVSGAHQGCMGVTHLGDPAADDAAQVPAEGTLYHLCDALEGPVGIVSHSLVIVIRKSIKAPVYTTILTHFRLQFKR